MLYDEFKMLLKVITLSLKIHVCQSEENIYTHSYSTPTYQNTRVVFYKLIYTAATQKMH